MSAARRFDILAGPAVGPVNLLAFFASCFGNCIIWRDVRYRIHRGGQIELLDRRDQQRPVHTARSAPPETRRAA